MDLELYFKIVTKLIFHKYVRILITSQLKW